MKTKKSIWSIALSLIIVLALVVGINLNMQPKAVNAENDEHITFDVKVDDVESKSVARNYASDLVVTYTVTETTGVDALQLRLGYDHDAFTLKSVVTNNATTLGEATKGKNGEIDNDNVVYENVDTEGITFVVNPEDNEYQPVLLITATFNLNHPTAATAYTFSLYNANDEEELNIGYSRAWRIESADEQSATHAPVEIRFANEAIVYVRGTYTDFTLTGGSKTYDGVAVPNSAITITHGENTPVEMRPAISAENVVWFTYNEALWQQQNVSRYIKLDSNPVAAGTYYAVVEFNGNNFYGSYKGYTADELYGDYGFDIGVGKVAEYVISPRGVNVTIDSKESAYGETLKPLTYTVDTQTPVIGNDDLGISLFSDANSLVPGTSPITGSAGNANYTVSFTNGTYTVTARNVTIIIADKTSAYGAAIVELTYTIDENTPVVGEDDLGISLSTTATSSSNVGTYPITGSASNTKYNVTFRNTAGTDTKGTYTITSQNINALNYFTGKTVTFDANSHDLLNVSNEKPNWVSYTAENNNQTNANTYTITITATIGAQDALNYLSSDLLAQLEQTENGYKYVTTVEGKINPVAVTVTADNKSHVYGNTPATLTPVTVGVNNEVTVNFVVKNANEETITLSTTTPVGTYTIVPSATNSNYAFTFNNGTYTVSKETATISISAEGIIYNRELNYTVSNAKVGTLDAPYTVEIRNSNNQVVTGVLPVGDYTIIATVAGTDNYNGATAQATFTVTPNVVGKPIVDLELDIEQIHFDNDTVTWDAVTKDTFGNDLYNTTVTYRINGVVKNNDNRSFTATSAGSYVLEILSSNENYLSNQVTLTVYSVTFTEGSHPASSTAEVEGLPATQYRFEGETATQPNATPTVTGYTFNGWDFDFETEIEENTEIPALWTIQQRTMTVVYVHSANNTYVETSKTFNVNYNSNVVINTSNFIDRAHITDIVSQYSLNGMRYTFYGFWNYKVTGEDEYIRENVTDIVVNATQPYTFVARYTATPIVYEITYNFSIDGADYTESIIENDQYTSAAYGSTINYVTPNSQKWFRVEAWYIDAERTQAAPVTMPAHDLTVYGALVFNVGKGDVNGDGYVDANDITLYRRWIVGGYEITALLNNNDLYDASEMETEDPSDTVYFIARVADTNAATLQSTVLGDQYLDIRDVSTIRMGLVGGYGFSIVENVDVTGEDLIIVREFEVESANDLLALARSGAKVTLSEDITDATLDAEILNSNKDIIIDLNGHTLTLKSFRVTLAQGNTGKILVTNGRINVSDGNGVYLTAVDGSVHLDDVTLYDDNGLFVIQTANHSLHLFNVVKFLKQEIVNNEPVEVAAEVKVEDGTHIVVETGATLTLAQIEVVSAEEAPEAIITIEVKQTQSQPIVVIGNVETEDATTEANIKNYVCYVMNNQTEKAYYESFAEAYATGKDVYLTADILPETAVALNGNATIYGNGHKLKAEISSNGTVTLNNVYTTNISVKKNGFSGTLIFNGGVLDTDRLGTADADAAFYSSSNKNATFEFHDMSISANITKGIKIYNAANVVIDGCEFDATKLQIMQGETNSNIQSLSLVDIQIDNVEANITIKDSTFIGAPQGSIAVPESVYGSGTMADSDTGAAIKLKVEKGAQFGNVVITGNTFENNYRDVIVGTAPYVNQLQKAANEASNGRSGDGLQYNTIDNWTISNNTTNLTAAVVENRGVATLSYFGGAAPFNKYTTKVGNVGEIEGGVAIWTITNAFEKVDDVWYYVENGNKYVVSEVNGKAVLTEVISTEEELVAAVNNGGNYKLIANINLNSQVVIAKDFTLDLNGKTITGRLSAIAGNVVLDNGTIVGRVDAYDASVLTLGADLVVENNDYAVVVWGATNKNPVLNVYGTVSTTNQCAISGNGTDPSNAVCNIYDGAVVTNTTDVAIYWPNPGTLNIKSGATISGATAVYIKSGVVNIEENATITSNLNEKVAYNFNGDGANATGDAIVIDNCDYPGGDAVVTIAGNYDIGRYYYVKTAQQLAHAASVGGKAQLANNIELNAEVVVYNDLVLDLNGHRIYNTVDIWDETTGSYALISVLEASLTINGDGEVVAKANDCYALAVWYEEGRITINGGSYVGNLHTIYAYEGIVTINGGEFDLLQLSDGTGEEPYRYELNCYDSNYRNGSANFVVKGGSFTHFNPQGSTGENPTANYVAEGYCAVEENGVYTVVLGVSEANGTGEGAQGNPGLDD